MLVMVTVRLMGSPMLNTVFCSAKVSWSSLLPPVAVAVVEVDTVTCEV